ncbi:MAG: ribosome-recycling factor [Candidatus Dojkabacteria bacterium]
MLFDEAKYKAELAEVSNRFSEELKKLKTGKAGMDAFKGIEIDQYGTMSPLEYAATISFPQPITANIKPFSKTDISKIASAIRNANMGGSVVEQSEMVIVNFLPLTQEDRDATSKELSTILEGFRVRARNVRQDYMQKVKALDGVSEDEQKASEKKIQELVDAIIKSLEELAADKNKEINPNAK